MSKYEVIIDGNTIFFYNSLGEEMGAIYHKAIRDIKKMSYSQRSRHCKEIGVPRSLLKAINSHINKLK